MEEEKLVEEKRVSLIEAQNQFGDAIDSALNQRGSRWQRQRNRDLNISHIQPPSVSTGPIIESAYNLGFATAKEGDEFSYLDRGDLGESVTSGVSKLQSELGARANAAFAYATKMIGDAESKVRAPDHKLSIWLLGTILLATIVIDSVAAHNALSIVWNAIELVTWGAAIAIALLLAIAGWVIAVTSVNLIGRIALWIGLVLSVISVVAVGWTAAELRGIQQSKESIQVQITDLQESIALLDTEIPPQDLTSDLEGLQTRLQELNGAFDTYVLFFYAGLILFTVCVASLAKAYEAQQQSQTYDRPTNKRQLERGKALASAESALEVLESWIPTSDSVTELGNLALSRYVDGFRKGLSPAQLDEYTKNAPNRSKMPAVIWTSDFKQKIEVLKKRLGEYRDQLSMPKTN